MADSFVPDSGGATDSFVPDSPPPDKRNLLEKIRDFPGEGALSAFQGAKDFFAHPNAKSLHQVISGGMQAASPFALPALVAAPAATLAAIPAGVAGSLTARGLASATGSSPDVSDVAGDIGGVIGGSYGARAGGALQDLASRIAMNPAAQKAAIGSLPFGKTFNIVRSAVTQEPQTPEPFRPNPNIQRQLNRGASGGAGQMGRLSPPTSTTPAIPGGAAPAPDIPVQETWQKNPNIQKQMDRGASGGTGSSYRLKPPPSKPSGGSSLAPPSASTAPAVDETLEGLAKSQTGKSFAKLTPEQQQSVRDLASKITQPGTDQPLSPPPAKPALEPPPGDRQARLHQQGGKTYSQYAEAKNQEIAKYLDEQGITAKDWDRMAPISKEAHIQKANPKYSPSSNTPRGFGRTAEQLYKDIGEALRERGR